VIAQDVHVGRDLELAFAREPAMVDRLVDGVGHGLVPAIAELDPCEVRERDAPQLVGRDAELAHVPRVDRDPAVRRPRAAHERHCVVEALDVRVERHELVGDRGVVVLGGVGAQLGEALGETVERHRRAGDVADLDVVRLEDGGGLEDHPPLLVGRTTLLVAGVEPPVHEELELVRPDPVRVEDLLELRERP